MTENNMSFGDDFVFTLFTNCVETAKAADVAGVDRVGLDLERLGKQERQRGLSTWISDHRKEHLSLIRNSLNKASLFVRTNPVHDGLKQEVDEYIAQGVNILMLPMFSTAQEAATFAKIVDGRATTVLLCETPAAALRLHQIVDVPGIDEIHIGLNDLKLGCKLRNHFEVLASDIMDSLAATVHDAGLPLGIGGIGRADDLSLPISPDYVFAQLVRLGATRALVSRAFFPKDAGEFDIAAEIKKVRQKLSEWSQASVESQRIAKSQLRTRLKELYQ